MWSDAESLMPGLEGDADASEFDAAAIPERALGMSDMPTLDEGPREGQRESVQAQALLEKAGRLRAKTNAEDQLELDRLTGAVRNALTDRRWPELSAACNDLSDVLFYLEDA
jgi:molecular chaperone DnaK